MPRLFPISVLMSALLSACADPSTSPGEAPVMSALRTTMRHSFGGICATTITPLTGPAEPVQRLHIGYVCHLRHLGRTTGSSEQTVTFAEGGSTIANTTTYTAANGDRLRATFSGTGSLPDANMIVTFKGKETYRGGTGRFEKSVGSARLTGSASLGTQTGHTRSEGSLTY